MIMRYVMHRCSLSMTADDTESKLRVTNITIDGHARAHWSHYKASDICVHETYQMSAVHNYPPTATTAVA